MEKARDILARFPEEWVAIEIVKDDELGSDASEGNLIIHSPYESEVWNTIRGDPRLIFVGYSGPMLAEGVDGILLCASPISVRP